MSGRIAQTEYEATGETPRRDAGNAALEQAIRRTRDYLLKCQNQEGYWVGELEADATVSAGYIPLMYFMTGKVDQQRKQKVVNFVRSKQNADGSWSPYQDGHGDLNATIQDYFSLKLAGTSPEEPFMQRAREFILSRGGITRANMLTRIWLAVFGQFDWRGTPSVPPELILFPNWFSFNIYEFASWSRATIVALMVISTLKPQCLVPEYARLSELFVEPEGRRYRPVGSIEKPFSRESFHLYMDRIFKAWERLPFQPCRRLALKKVEKWIVEHQEADGSWSGIMLPWVYSLIALKSLGYTPDHPVIRKGIEGLESFTVEDDNTLKLQPATSPVWDTAWAMIALGESGLPSDHPALAKAARWLLSQEVRVTGDWQVKNPRTSPGCWAFEFENDLYPDIDDTAVVPRALLKSHLTEQEEKQKVAAIDRALHWVLDMQGDDGGWAAFDRNNNMAMLEHIPFADFMTPLDPTSPDVTAHVLELLGELNVQGAVRGRALDYIRKAQEPDGAWFGRWGVNYIYGTGLVLAGLQALGEDMSQSYIRRAVAWLECHQNKDGGWGESCYSYHEPSCRGIGQSTASQTAWALLGLLAAGETSGQAVSKGIEYLLGSQHQDGSWIEEAFTGTGFPRAFYLRYDLYRVYFPLLALARYRASVKEG